MKIELSKIKASSKPIRSSWDEAKMNDLKWSLMEEGQVEPIGVHENGNGYVIVWGHRRTEAARRAAWTEIEAVVVPQDEVDNLIHAGIENLSGEDMSADDKADWAQRLIELGLTIREISRRSTIAPMTISNWLAFRREKEAGVYQLVHSDTGRDEGIIKTLDIARVLGDDIEAKKAVATKSSNDQLTSNQTRSVAEAYRDAPTPEVRAQVLKAPIQSRDTAADILRRSLHRVEIDKGIESIQETNAWQEERKERREMQAWDFAVKEFLDTTKMYADITRKVTNQVRYGKYSPEAARFAIRKIDGLIDLLKTAKDELEQVK